MRVIFNGEPANTNDTRICALSSGLYYGTGCFETFRGYRGKYLHLEKHITRLNRGLEWLGAPYKHLFSADKVRQDLKQLLSSGHLQDTDTKIRIQAVLNDGGGYGGSANVSTDLIITAEPYSDEKESVRLCTVSTRTIPSECRPSDLKMSNMLHYRRAFREAEDKGFDDGLMLNTQGYVSETSISNIFWKKGNLICTPSPDCDNLPGIMRETVVGLIRKMEHYELIEDSWKPEELMKADQIWLTNSVREIRWVKELDVMVFTPDFGFRSDLENRLNKYKKEHLE